ncbi:Abi-alpha family protein, partial [Elizabethkingia miricola]
MNDINNSLINIGNNKIVEKVYDDIISNPSKKVGETLGTIIDISNTLLWPIKWANARTRIYFVNNLKKYEEKLSRINLEKIIEVPTEISMPILERFTYVSNEEIGNAFVNLLTSASNIDTVQFAHPSFIQIIDRLSPDEARIIKYFAQQRLNVVPYITLAKYQLEQVDQKNQPIQHINTSQYVIISNKTDNLFSNIELNFKDNTGIY